MLLKRDDLYEIHGQWGGKARTCAWLASGAAGLVTASSRRSPQAEIVAGIAAGLGIPARIHVAAGGDTNETTYAKRVGAELVYHNQGYNTVVIARAREDAAARGWADIPFGMEHEQAVILTAAQVANLPLDACRRIVVAVGSGMSLAGILQGLIDSTRGTWAKVPPVVGVGVGARPFRRLARWAPMGYPSHVDLLPPAANYHTPVQGELDGVALDPYYEAKVLPFLQDGDLFWIVGRRHTLG